MLSVEIVQRTKHVDSLGADSWSRGGGKRTKPAKIRFEPATTNHTAKRRKPGRLRCTTTPRHSAASRQPTHGGGGRRAAGGGHRIVRPSRSQDPADGRIDAALLERGPRLGGRGRGLVLVLVRGGQPPRRRRGGGAPDVRPAVGGGPAGGRADAGAGARRALHPGPAALLRPRALARLHLPGPSRYENLPALPLRSIHSSPWLRCACTWYRLSDPPRVSPGEHPVETHTAYAAICKFATRLVQ
jgi:hypothetical protein